jgi:hypothetical protein
MQEGILQLEVFVIVASRKVAVQYRCQPARPKDEPRIHKMSDNPRKAITDGMK